jgi:hypothetical protein
MKRIIFIIVFSLIAKLVHSQDLTDEKDMRLLKNLKYVSKAVGSTKFSSKYSVILNDNLFLNIKYNIAVNEEYNGSYTFVRVTDDPLQKNDREYNYNYLLTHISSFCTVLNISAADKGKIKAAIIKQHSEFAKKEVSIEIDSIKGYDEFFIRFSNFYNLISCNFFFRRLL